MPCTDKDTSGVLVGSCQTTGCVQGQRNFSPALSIPSLVFILAWVFLLFPLLFTFLGFALQIPSTTLQPRIPPSHFHPVFLNVISLCIISLFSLGLMAPSSLLYRCFFNLMDFLRFLWSAVGYFYSSPDVQVKLALQASQISPFNSVHCLSTTEDDDPSNDFHFQSLV